MSGPTGSTPWMGPLPAAPGCDCQVCRPEASYDDLDRETIDDVLQHGWQVVLVAEAAGCSAPEHHDDDHDRPGVGDSPAFAYTLGLGHRAGHPELMMSGLDPHLMHRVLDGLARRVMDGRRFVAGEAVEDALAGVPVAVERVSGTGLRETVTWSGWFHRRPPDALAVVWPDRRGVFGWQPGAPEVLDELQPPVWREPSERRGALAADPAWVFSVPPDQKVFSCTHVVDRGDAVLWAARESDASRGEDWSIHCGATGHETDEMRLVHLAHLVRSAPSLVELSGLGLDEEAERADVDSPWTRSSLTT